MTVETKASAQNKRGVLAAIGRSSVDLLMHAVISHRRRPGWDGFLSHAGEALRKLVLLFKVGFRLDPG